jgi:hypothetical protein
MGIYKFGNNTYPRQIRHRLNLGYFFPEKKVRLMVREICNRNLYPSNCSVCVYQWNQMCERLEILHRTSSSLWYNITEDKIVGKCNCTL